MKQYDLAIAGAGPAGSVLALLAARSHYRVLLVERSRFEKPRLGETASPELRAALARVGLERLAQAPFCRDAPEVVSVWGSDEPISRHHIFSPYGAGLHLDRRAFDEALALAACDAGADVKLGCSARFKAEPEGGHVVRLSTGEESLCRRAVLATGRAGGGAGLPYRREYLDDNIAVAARLALPARASAAQTMIEAVTGGWFYAAALPGNEAVAVLITAAALVPRARRARLRWWLEALARTRMVRQVLSGCRVPEAVSVTDARASFARSGAGDGWLALGDARIAPDPLSGQGILWALDDAASATELLTRPDWSDIAAEMRARTRDDVEAYRLERSRVYESEQRFKNDAYWSAASGPSARTY